MLYLSRLRGARVLDKKLVMDFFFPFDGTSKFASGVFFFVFFVFFSNVCVWWWFCGVCGLLVFLCGFGCTGFCFT